MATASSVPLSLDRASVKTLWQSPFSPGIIVFLRAEAVPCYWEAGNGINPLLDMLSNLTFHPIEVVRRSRDQQLQTDEKVEF